VINRKTAKALGLTLPSLLQGRRCHITTGAHRAEDDGARRYRLSSTRVEIVFDPSWDSCKMSDAAKLPLGLL